MMKFIYITPFVDEEFFIPLKKGIRDAADMLKVSAEFTGTPGADLEAFTALVEKAIAEKYDGIALSFAHGENLTPLVKKAGAVGIPVTAFNMDFPASGRLAGVSQNFYKAGLSLGKRAAGKLGKNITVLGVMHDPGVECLEDRLRGISDGLKELNVTVKTVYSGNVSEKAKELILKEITPDVKAILCTGQPDLHGAGLAVKSLPEGSRPYVAGFDVCDEINALIREGIIDFTIDQQPYVQGFYPLLLMYQHLKCGITPFDIDTGAAIVDKSVI
jgi:simple sugar transport system substrate-binding protein